jgi:hypothetical protein
MQMNCSAEKILPGSARRTGALLGPREVARPLVAERQGYAEQGAIWMVSGRCLKNWSDKVKIH